MGVIGGWVDCIHATKGKIPDVPATVGQFKERLKNGLEKAIQSAGCATGWYFGVGGTPGGEHARTRSNSTPLSSCSMDDLVVSWMDEVADMEATQARNPFASPSQQTWVNSLPMYPLSIIHNGSPHLPSIPMVLRDEYIRAAVACNHWSKLNDKNGPKIAVTGCSGAFRHRDADGILHVGVHPLDRHSHWGVLCDAPLKMDPDFGFEADDLQGSDVSRQKK